MNKETEENRLFINEIVHQLLEIPNLVETIDPDLTADLIEKYQKAGERFTQIINSFNALPGVRAQCYYSDCNPDALLEIEVPATSLFLINKEAYKDGSGTNEIIIITVGFRKAQITYTDLGERNKPEEASMLCQNWQKEIFGSVSSSGEILNKKAPQKEITIPELYTAVQQLINSYLKVLNE